jgi:hypothetical protein
MYKFVKVCNQCAVEVGKGSPLDVKTRWSSTYRMLDCCLTYNGAFGYYYEVDNNYEWQASPTQWKLFESVKPILIGNNGRSN